MIVKELNGWCGKACLVEINGEHFVISSIAAAPDHGGPETLAFRADADGEVDNYADVAGGRGWTREQTIAELENLGAVKNAGRGMFADPENPTGGELLTSMVSILDQIGRGETGNGEL